MVDLTGISFPTDEESAQHKRFTTYLNYLSSISLFLRANSKHDNLKDVVNSRAFMSIQGGRCQDLKRVEKILRNAWFTEIQLHMPAQNKEFAKYANHWAVVQLYYSVFLCLRAFFESKNHTINQDHTNTLKETSEFIKKCPDLFPLPYRILCLGNPDIKKAEFLNLPSNVIIGQTSNLANNAIDDFWTTYTRFLRKTREKGLKKKYEAWKKEHNKQKIKTDKKEQIIKSHSPTSFFHCIYKLRLISNYSDAEYFLMSIGREEDMHTFNQSLRVIAWFSLQVIELLIARNIGKSNFNEITKNFEKDSPANITQSLFLKRWNHAKSLW